MLKLMTKCRNYSYYFMEQERCFSTKLPQKVFTFLLIFPLLHFFNTSLGRCLVPGSDEAQTVYSFLLFIYVCIFPSAV